MIRKRVVNLDQKTESEGKITVRYGDATNLAEFDDGEFDIVHSNSVIEHVGHWTEMQAFAREASRVAPKHFIQTPNFWFPYEPHYRKPLYQFLPEDVRVHRLTRKQIGFAPQAGSYREAREWVETCNLLSARQMRDLFPESEIYREKFFGLTKSLVAIRA